MLRDATQTTLFEILDKNRIPYEHNKAENTVVLRDTRSRILFRPVEEFDRLRGTTLAWFGLDELTYTQEEAWVVLEGRLRDPKATRLCGFASWTPKGFDWVYRRFVQERVEGYEVIVAEAFENRYLLERIPDFYERLKRSYDAKFYEQEVMGQYISLNAGLVFRREPILSFEGDNEAAKAFFCAFTEDCDLKQTSLSDFFRRQLAEALVSGASYILADFPRIAQPAANRAEEEQRGASRAYLVEYRAEDLINWNYDEQGNLDWVVLRTSNLRQDTPDDGWFKETRWVYYDKEEFRIYRRVEGKAARKARRNWWTRGDTGWPVCGAYRCSSWKSRKGCG
jgi:hypothetical protein